MFAAVDLGSNSFRLHIGKPEGDGIRIVKSMRDPIRLAAGLDNRGNLTPAAMQTALATLQAFREVLASYSLDAVRVVATNTLRVAENAAAFLPVAEKAIGYPIEIISGEEEGRLIYMGVASKLAVRAETRLVVDIGGGSTELIVGTGAEIALVESFSVGTVPQTQGFFIDGHIDAASFEAAILSARAHFEDLAPSYRACRCSNAYGSSGTIRAIADVMQKNSLGDGSLSLENLQALKLRFIASSHISHIALLGMRPDRAAVMVGGLAILIGVMLELALDAITPISAGLRLGVLRDLQLRAAQRDRRELSVRDCMQRFHADADRARRVAASASVLYGRLKPAVEGLARYLAWSGLLHEVGLVVSHSSYHKHAAYLIENSDLPGFTTREQRLMSRLILAQKGNLRKVEESLSDPDFAKAVLALRLAVMFMHMHSEVDLDALQLKMKSRIELTLQRDWVRQHPTITCLLEKEQQCWQQVGIDFDVRSD